MPRSVRTARRFSSAASPIVQSLERRTMLASATAAVLDYAAVTRQRIAVNFDADVSAGLSSSSVVATNLRSMASVPLRTPTYIAGSNQALFEVDTTEPYVSDGNYELLVDRDGVSPNLSDDLIASDFFLDGDFNHDRVVNYSDLTTLSANYNQSGATFAQGDTNYDGTVNFTDLLALGARYGVTVSPLPTAATGLIADPTGVDGTSITWNYDVGDVAIDGFTVYRSMDGVVFDAVADVPYVTGRTSWSWTDSGLTDGMKYWYRVRPYHLTDTNNDGVADAPEHGLTTSKDWAVTTLRAPTGVGASASTGSRVALNWTMPADTPATGYNIWVSYGSGNFQRFDSVDGAARSYSFLAVQSAHTRFAVSATTRDAESVLVIASLGSASAPAGEGVGTTDPVSGGGDFNLTDGLVAPTGLATSGSAYTDHVQFNWSAVDGADSYLIEWAGSDGDFFAIDETEGTSYTDEYPALGAQSYRVRALVTAEDVYESAPSSALPVQPIAPPVASSDDNGGPNDRGTISAYVTNHNSPLTIYPLGNDPDYDSLPGEAIELVNYSSPEHGSLTYDESSLAFTYTPDTSFVGTDHFRYTVGDGSATGGFRRGGHRRDECRAGSQSRVG
ncbi:MAG: Ig-like domain-containing protein [Tepidisphaeraceae bacterium]